ncbi:MAG: internalization-related competence protein ComEC/Rec2 protein [candidate division WWE3 bacterium GW2011_GWF2_41_45]|uniref:Metallo-beta-lactamase domain-containing protein n=3 Tax=Katanobacteria TaxID=422282 RepID=A0A1F4VZQ7_UNCKA|nr:MAG: internalization-related competence protein ComEC/Rec2 protein [candidate division WWE3 bacterium GW2011_GWC2_41_23]KKS10215.1 MAG: internalization-related competence protein ComEC/Rec2 protein [candidate division WWE3 bacterium GW2011_GWF2_41_45]KKS19557.1 MAG: internalization-related competence protein ComEC/Rec2 protein [candidate division WWE3 bacterium GW2011_GWE1_41_72]KKS28412.1 MAG: internalization-related competence protein ComEC/Rec2 protein [candidate division WWE3 bacterium GW
MKGAILFQIIFVTAYIVVFQLVVSRRLLSGSGMSVHVIDVGQGDGIYIELNGKPVALIDGGGDYTADKYILEKTGLGCNIPLVVLSHDHGDHFVGFKRILERCKFGILRYNDVVLDGLAVPSSVKNNPKNKVKKTFDGEQFVIRGVFIKLFVPYESIHGMPKNLNNASVVLLAKYKDFEVLSLGDLEAEGQERLDLRKLKRLISGRLDVLKISHHGAVNGYSRELVAELKPVVCVISVGEFNTFEHPSLPVIEELEAAGCGVIRTDKVGDVVISSR